MYRNWAHHAAGFLKTYMTFLIFAAAMYAWTFPLRTFNSTKAAKMKMFHLLW